MEMAAESAISKSKSVTMVWAWMKKHGAAAQKRLNVTLEGRRIVLSEDGEKLPLPARPFQKGSHVMIIGRSRPFMIFAAHGAWSPGF